jgi:proteasome accessory factor A
MLPGARIFGVETEFGCLVRHDDSRPEAAVEMIKDHVFEELKLGLIDLTARDEVFEPAESGGFLINGARLYVDAVGSHLEYATAECQTLKDLVANDRAGQRLIVRAIQEMGLDEDISIYSNAVDHFGGHTFGCHENYLVQMDEDFFSTRAPLLYPFLVTRQIFAGVGRVGGHMLVGGMGPTMDEIEQNPVDYIWVSQVYSAIPDDSVEYQLSQRADHILKAIAGRVRFNRALINPKWEHFYAHEGRHRLHLLFGEQNQSEFAYALKIGTTHLVLKLIEDGHMSRRFTLANPLRALRDVSRDPTFRWRVVLADGEIITAIDLQREICLLCKEHYWDDSEETNWIITQWLEILDGLEKDPMALDDKLDWVAKKKVVQMAMEDMGADWTSDALHSIDLEYHNIDPERSLFHAWNSMKEMKRYVTELDILDASTDPPQNTRAKGRSLAIHEILKRKIKRGYSIDWNGVLVDRTIYMDMPDPFDTYTD